MAATAAFPARLIVMRFLCPLFLVTLITASAADAPKKLPASVETDSRLHADGKGWRLDKAKITDPKRPRVLLVGDSILNGYLKTTVAALEGKAYVDAWVNPYNQSEHLNKNILPEVLAHGPYDVVHFADFRRRCVIAGTDRPHGFVGKNKPIYLNILSRKSARKH